MKGIALRVSKALERNDLTYAQAEYMTDEELLSVPGIGPSSVAYFRDRWNHSSPRIDHLPRWLSLEVHDLLVRSFERALEEKRTVVVQVVVDDVAAVLEDDSIR